MNKELTTKKINMHIKTTNTYNSSNKELIIKKLKSWTN